MIKKRSVFFYFFIFYVFFCIFFKLCHVFFLIIYWILFLEPTGRPRFLGAWSVSTGTSLDLFLEPLGRPRFLGASVTSVSVGSEAVIWETSLGGGKMRSVTFVVSWSTPPWNAKTSEGMSSTKVSIFSMTGMVISGAVVAILSEVGCCGFGGFLSVWKFLKCFPNAWLWINKNK